MHGSANGRADTKLTWRGRNPNHPPGMVVGDFLGNRARRRARARSVGHGRRWRWHSLSP